MTPEQADAAQQWAGMPGSTAWLLIERHADGWDDISAMMEAWLRANVAHQLAPLQLAVLRAEDRREGAIDIDIVRRALLHK